MVENKEKTGITVSIFGFVKAFFKRLFLASTLFVIISFGGLFGITYYLYGIHSALDMYLPEKMGDDQSLFVSELNNLQIEYRKKDNDLHRAKTKRQLNNVICKQTAITGFKNWTGLFVDVDRNGSSYDLYFEMPGLKSVWGPLGKNYEIIIQTEGSFDFLGEAFTKLIGEEHYGLNQELPANNKNTSLLTSLELHEPVKISGLFAREDNCLQVERGLFGLDKLILVANISDVVKVQ
jgi:hypothetical protein